MRPLIRLTPRAWIAAPLLALALVLVPAALRLRHVILATDQAGRSPAERALPAASSAPELIVPGQADVSLGWLDLTREMFAHREARVRHIDYENAPQGHEVNAMSPYRWWLGLAAGANHLLAGPPAARAVELAALYADPLLQVLLILAAGFGAVRGLGPAPAAAVALGLACFYPLNHAFLPGVVSDRGLTAGLQLGGLLLLLGAMRDGLTSPARRKGFALAGVVGGLGLWVNAMAELPVLAGVAVGAVVAAFFRRAAGTEPWPWRAWGLAGATTVLAAYGAEFAPGHMGAWDFGVIHPVYGLVWLGVADLVARAAAAVEGRPAFRGRRDVGWAVLSVAAVAALPAGLRWFHASGFFEAPLHARRLSLELGSPAAASLWAWLVQNGVTAAVAATFAPLLLVPAAVGLVLAGRLEPARRAALAWSLGPAAVALAWAVRQISWWNAVDAALLAVAAGLAAAVFSRPLRTGGRAAAAALAAAALLPGLIRGWPEGAGASLADAEVYGLVERDLAGWLARHAAAAGAVVLAPPAETVALHYYAGIRGLGTLNPDNRDGLQAAVRMVSASTPEEALDLLTQRGVSYLILPSWDAYFDTFARIGEGQVAGTFLERLHEWLLPPWLRPVAYPIPSIPGFEGQSVTVLQVVDEQDAATAAAHLTEYFIDMNQPQFAAAAGKLLRRYPADLGAAVAQAELAVAAGDAAATRSASDALVRRLASGADRELPWEQRISLYIVLGQTHHLDLAGPRLKEALADADADKLRDLRTSDLYRLEILLHALGLGFPTAPLAAEARDLLPPDLRAQLGINVQ